MRHRQGQLKIFFSLPFKRNRVYIGTKGQGRILMDHINSLTYYPFTSSNETQLNQNSKHLTYGVKFTGDYRNVAIILTLFRDHSQNSKKPNFSSFFRLFTVIPK